MNISYRVPHNAKLGFLRGITRAEANAMGCFLAKFRATFVQVFANIVVCRQKSAQAHYLEKKLKMLDHPAMPLKESIH